MVDLSIIIVSWNCRQYLKDCLHSLPDSIRHYSYRVIVVDNGSTDGTPSMVEEEYPDVNLVKNSSNRGFAAANNQAFQSSASRYVLMLNADTILQSGALDNLIRFLDQHPEVWAAGPSMRNGDMSLQRTGVRFPSNWNILVETFFLDRMFPRSRVFGRHRELYEDPMRSRKVDYLQGSCLMFRSEVFNRIGYLDEEYFMYFEETDFCYRIQKAGGATWCVPDANVVHFGGNRVGHYDEKRLVYYHQGLLRFYRKHYQGKQLFLRIIVLIRSVLRLVLWAVIFAVRPSLRDAARSSIRGYQKVTQLVFR